MKNKSIENEVFEYGKVYEFLPKLFEKDLGFESQFHKSRHFSRRFVYKGKSSDTCHIKIKKPGSIFIKVKGNNGRVRREWFPIDFFVHRKWCKEVK